MSGWATFWASIAIINAMGAGVAFERHDAFVVFIGVVGAVCGLDLFRRAILAAPTPSRGDAA